MLETAYIINFLGMILLPMIAFVYFKRKFNLTWKLIIAGGLTFIASQVLHIPLVLTFTKTFLSWGMVAYAIVLGLLAGLFEETARYILFKFILKKSRTWKEGVFVGLGHGGIEAILLGITVALAFVNMMAYRNIDLSTVPGIPPEQLELAKQQVAAYWSAPVYTALLGMVERVFAMCLHVALSVMVLYGIANKRPIWFWLAVLWHTIIDAVAVYVGQQGSMLVVEGLVAVFAMISVGIVIWLKPKFASDGNVEGQSQPSETAAG